MRLNVKKLFTVATSTVMAFAFSATAFAATNSASGPDFGSAYYMYNRDTSVGSMRYLNLEGNESYASNHRAVTRYSMTSSNDQRWYVGTSKYDNQTKMYSYQADMYGNRDYALNLYRPNCCCDIYRETAQDPNTADSALTISGTLSDFAIYPTSWGSGYSLGARSGDRLIGWDNNFPLKRWNKSMIS